MLLEYSVENPLNREPPMKQLVQSFITKSSTAYDRNHGPIPHINPETHLVKIDGAVRNVLQLSIKELAEDFEQYEVETALQCAGNRRHTMRTELKEVEGIDWFDGAVMNGLWRGPLLRDILNRASVTIEGDAHVAFASSATEVQDDHYYGASIPLERCMDPDKEVIVCLELNGSPLNINHGSPVRLVAPGIAGARWVKWLDKITVQRNESNNFYQQRDYKILPPQVTTKELAMRYWELVPAMQEMPINSVIAYPSSDSVIMADTRDGKVEVAGYALPQGDDGPVTKVEISLDKGKTWEEAEIVHRKPSRWSWALWKTRIDIRKLIDETGTESSKSIWSRCWDKGRNLQTGDSSWNWRGVGYNGYGESKNLKLIGLGDLPPSNSGHFTNGITNKP